MIIREACETDAPEMLAGIQQLIAEPNNNIPWHPDEFKRTVEDQQRMIRNHLDEPNSIYLVAEEEGRIIGEINCKGGERWATQHIALIGMYIHKDWRGQGVGSTLMQHAIDWAKQSGLITRLELLVYARNVSAIGMYEKHGFEVEGRRRRAIYQHGEYLDSLMMSLLL
jgi:RimJ/RimL family protein N-acetyltransferase